MSAIGRFQKRVSALGLMGAIRHSVHKSMAGKRRKTIFAHDAAEERFTEIYNSNHWNDTESRSGVGSTMKNTSELRAALPSLFAKYKIETLLDAPCGDFNWMKSVVAGTTLTYIGGDIVRPLIESNAARNEEPNIRFAHIDLTKSPLPDADLLLCRDCLFHLSYGDIAKVLANVLSSNIPLLLTTTNVVIGGETIENHDIKTGDMRPINLFAQPFGVSRALDEIHDNLVSHQTHRKMILLDRPEIERVHANLMSATAS